MEYLVAASSADGTRIDQHFGRTQKFLILKVEENERFRRIGTRDVMPVCQCGGHDDNKMESVIRTLEDCRYVLSVQIGPGAQAALQQRGITPLESNLTVDYTLEKVMLYDSRFGHFKHDKHERK